MLPFLRAAVTAGHDLRVAAPGDVAKTAAGAGFAVEELPGSPPEKLGAIFGSLGSLPREEANTKVVREVFGGLNVEATLPALESLVADWRPDVVVRETGELASFVAATRAGVPVVTVSIGLRRVDDHFMTAIAAGGFPDRYGADPRDLAAVRTLSLMPPSLDGAGDRPREHYRDTAALDETPLPREWWPGDDRPLVYVTFGSIAASIGLFPALYRAALDALADLPVRVLMTVGAASDPDVLAPVPANAHVERWVPQAGVLREAAVVVGHGGFGTTLGALVAGVPMVNVPLFTPDQHDNAAAVAAAGAGVALPGGPEAMAGLGAAVTGVLADDAARSAAQRVAAEIADLPPAAAWLDR